MNKSNNQNAQYVPKRFHKHLQAKEGQIIQAAFDCIVERDVAATSTHAIAARGSMSQGSIHYYFKNKDDLLLYLLEILFQNFIENIETIVKSPFVMDPNGPSIKKSDERISSVYLGERQGKE